MNLRHTTSLLSLSASTLKSVFGTPRHDHASDPLPLAVAGESLALIAHLTASASVFESLYSLSRGNRRFDASFCFRRGSARAKCWDTHACVEFCLFFYCELARPVNMASVARPTRTRTRSRDPADLKYVIFLLLSVSFLSPTIDSLCPDWDARRHCAVLPFTLPTTTPSQIDRLSVCRSLIFESDRLGLVRVVLYHSSSIHMYVHLISLRAEYVPG